MRIVIVEDEIRIREGVRRLLNKILADCDIVGEAQNGEEGLELILSAKPDLVITDIKMPKMDGLEMLTRLHRQNSNIKVIVLSAYSEFAYAQQAIKLGVNEYLLKPIALENFSKSIRNIESQIAHERVMSAKNPRQLRTLDNIIYNILFNDLQIDPQLQQFLGSGYLMDTNSGYAAVVMYLGADYAGQKEFIRDLAVKKLSNYKFQLVELPQEKEYLLIIYNLDDPGKYAAHFKKSFMPQMCKGLEGSQRAVGIITFDGIHKLRESFRTISTYLGWNMVLGSDAVLSYPDILEVHPNPLSYPIELEAQAKAAVCSVDRARLKKTLQAFTLHLFCQIHDPTEVKETTVRFVWAIITILKELNYTVYNKIEQQTLLEQIMSAVTQHEVSNAVMSILDFMPVADQDDELSLHVKRAKSMVYELYDKGITLDEIAYMLGITPEYLSTQFHKEIGENFNTFINNCRIKKAKELLISTDMKLYEIAQAVGYSDPKYFSRVFSGKTGHLPSDYRKIYK